jgi:23S rRNA (cytosine1962-C5)-methyltransferase
MTHEATGRRIAVRLTPDALRVARAGHPWVFDGAIRSVSHVGEPGDLAVVFDDKRRFAAIGLWDPSSPIRIKLLHAGEPVTIDEAFWRGRVEAALARRGAFTSRADAGRLGYRVLNGESDGTPGLVADRYASVLVVKVYRPAIAPHVESIVDALVGATGCSAVVLRCGRQVGSVAGHHDGDVLVGSLPQGEVTFVEHGLEFAVDVVHGQKTGFFLDQRPLRASVAQLSSGADVLDTFASSGAFSVHAAAGGARRVRAVDVSASALRAAVDNMARNRHHRRVARCSFVGETADAFVVLGRLGDERQRFDVVVVDPPSFAVRQSQVAGALRAYARLTRLALRTVRPGGLLVQASCSSRVSAAEFYRVVAETAASSRATLVELERHGHDVDHPATFPEAHYLKSGIWRVDR